MLLSVHHLAWPESFEGSPSCLCNGASSRLHESQTVLVVKEYPTVKGKKQRRLRSYGTVATTVVVGERMQTTLFTFSRSSKVKLSEKIISTCHLDRE